MSKELWVSFSKRQLLSMFIYFVIILLFGILIAIIKMIEETNKSSSFTLISLFMFGIGFEMIGNSIYYIRRLYKNCINNSICCESQEPIAKKIGVIMYLLTRPIFGIVFLFLGIVLYYNFIISLVYDINALTSSYINFLIFYSIIIGFSTGCILDIILDKSTKFAKFTFGE